MKEGDKVKVGDSNKIWIIDGIFRSFIILTNGRDKKYIYKFMYPSIEIVK